MCIEIHNLKHLLQFFLWAKLRSVSTLFLAAVLGTGGKTGVAFTADHTVTVEFFGKSGKGWVNGTATKTED